MVKRGDESDAMCDDERDEKNIKSKRALELKALP
jgi:hypothetical protein